MNFQTDVDFLTLFFHLFFKYDFISFVFVGMRPSSNIHGMRSTNQSGKTWTFIPEIEHRYIRSNPMQKST